MEKIQDSLSDPQQLQKIDVLDSMYVCTTSNMDTYLQATRLDAGKGKGGKKYGD